eukprot:TRINITY_DN1274_c1_g1_i1.p2 TRINITY_DN1274_c1_g1~~TRINITY_DN1274_c1_g1_i1.p2  ORF type:complete len:136 (+),score=29.88 TRINITY_DN1274_c1_g1_i1:69-476(+)
MVRAPVSRLEPREPSDEEKEVICGGVKDGKVTLPGKDGEYRIDYGVSSESRVTSEETYKKRTEKITCSQDKDVIYFTVVTEAKGGVGEDKAELPAPLQTETVKRKPCVFFNKGTCKTGLTCEFGHNYVKPKVFRK